MKTFEIWTQQSNGWDNTKALHIITATKFSVTDSLFVFYDDGGKCLHAIAHTPGMIVKSI